MSVENIDKARRYLLAVAEDSKPIGLHPDGTKCYTKNCSLNKPAGNRNTIVFRRWLGHASENVVREYEKSVDNSILVAYQKAVSGEAIPTAIPIRKSVSNILIHSVKHLLDLDIRGYSVWIDIDHLRHINKDHGTNGVSDHSMADDRDVARMGYVIDNPDQVSCCLNKDGSPRLAAVYNNKNGSKASTILIRKQVNGHYYVAEAVVDGKRKRIYVTGAYKNRGLDPQEVIAEKSAPIERLKTNLHKES